MVIGGFQRFSLIDYPGKICAIIFTQGCNFRCPYCHNPELIDLCVCGDPISEEEIFAFLKKRRGKLDAVEVTGGEPTLHPDLVEFLEKIREMDYLVKLDTNGSRPEMLEEVIERRCVDYLAMDVKSSLGRYKEVVRCGVDVEKIRKSIQLIMGSGLRYELRTTVASPLVGRDDILEIGNLIKGAEVYALQRFVSSKTLSPELLNGTDYSDEELEELKNAMERNYVTKCIVR